MAAKRNKWLAFPLLLAAVVLASALLFWMGFRHDNKYIRPRHEAKLGITWLDMERYEADPLLFLVEGWEFYGGKLLTPEEIPNHTPDAAGFGEMTITILRSALPSGGANRTQAPNHLATGRSITAGENDLL